jgi:hypothetical protein
MGGRGAPFERCVRSPESNVTWPCGGARCFVSIDVQLYLQHCSYSAFHSLCAITNLFGRLLRDVRYLHDKMSGLKHVGAPTGMLETVVQEKTVAEGGGKGKGENHSRFRAKMAAVVGSTSTSSSTSGSEAAPAQPSEPGT